MSLADETELADQITTSLGALKEVIEGDDVDFAAETTIKELGLDLPFDGDPPRLEYWIIQRGKRHALDIMRINAAYKFKYKQINLNQRFEHLDKVVNKMDEKFEEALENDPALAGIIPSLTELLGPRAVGGDYLPSGFVYDDYGNDVTAIVFNELFPDAETRGVD